MGIESCFIFYSSLAVNLSTDKPSRLHWIKSVLTGCIGELLGTFLLTVIICTVVTTAVITGNSAVLINSTIRMSCYSIANHSCTIEIALSVHVKNIDYVLGISSTYYIVY